MNFELSEVWRRKTESQMSNRRIDARYFYDIRVLDPCNCGDHLGFFTLCELGHERWRDKVSASPKEAMAARNESHEQINGLQTLH
ncbi:hypothetical protein Bca4012_017395 [Brassica carinata]